jgi:hypothetical protein
MKSSTSEKEITTTTEPIEKSKIESTQRNPLFQGNQ